MGSERQKTALRRPGAGGGLGLAAAVLGLGVAACASISATSAPEAKQQFVAERAEARWQALIKGDVDGAYTFLSAASRKATPLQSYKSVIKPGMWRQAKAEKVDCKDEICEVQLSVTYDAKQMKGITTPVRETWIIEDGSAWFVYR